MIRNINVSLVYARPERQWLFEAQVERGCSASDLIETSNFLKTINDLQNRPLESLELGVYAQRIESDYLLQDGDRVEIYRPLTADPKEVRRQLAKLGKTMGKK